MVFLPPDCTVQIKAWQHPLLWARRRAKGPVAQLDRALPSEGKGHAFESRRVHHYPVKIAENSHFIGRLDTCQLWVGYCYCASNMAPFLIISLFLAAFGKAPCLCLFLIMGCAGFWSGCHDHFYRTGLCGAGCLFLAFRAKMRTGLQTEFYRSWIKGAGSGDEARICCCGILFSGCALCFSPDRYQGPCSPGLPLALFSQ